MADAITIKALQDASLDAKSLEEVVNGNETKQVTTRLGESYPSVKKAVKTLFENGGLPATPFATKALMTASALVDGKYAMVTDDADGLNGLYVKADGLWRRTKYTTTMSYIDLKAGQDLLLLPKGHYVIPDFEIGNSLINMVDVYYKYGTVVVERNGAGDQFVKITISTYRDGIYINRNNEDGWTGWQQLPLNEYKVIANGQDILQLPIGNYYADGFTTPNLINFPSVDSYQYGTVVVEKGAMNAQFKTVTVSTYRDPAIYINKNNEAGWMGWVKIGAIDDAPATTKPVVNPILPANIYTLNGLEAHIYPEHLFLASDTIYNQMIGCNVGQHTKRGWVLSNPVATPTSSLLIWEVHDKVTAEKLGSSSCRIITGNKAKAGFERLLLIGDSYINSGAIGERILAISASDPLTIALEGSRGGGANKHEGRGGWRVDDYATAGRTYYKFTVSGVTTAPAINAATYNYSGGVFYVQEVSLTGGSGTLVGYHEGTPPSGSGVLTKSNDSAGDTTINFSAVAAVSGNPFWQDGKIDFSKYLTEFNQSIPNYVAINLGVNDSFGFMDDASVVSKALAQFVLLDALIASIKVSNSGVKIGLMTAPVYADQDAFGKDYGSYYTSWRTSRNIAIWNRELIKYYKDKEAQGIYIVAAGLNVDTKNNMPTVSEPINSHNSALVIRQSNSVHPDVSGYYQIADSVFAWIKSV